MQKWRLSIRTNCCLRNAANWWSTSGRRRRPGNDFLEFGRNWILVANVQSMQLTAFHTIARAATGYMAVILAPGAASLTPTTIISTIDAAIVAHRFKACIVPDVHFAWVASFNWFWRLTPGIWCARPVCVCVEEGSELDVSTADGSPSVSIVGGAARSSSTGESPRWRGGDTTEFRDTLTEVLMPRGYHLMLPWVHLLMALLR